MSKDIFGGMEYLCIQDISTLGHIIILPYLWPHYPMYVVKREAKKTPDC